MIYVDKDNALILGRTRIETVFKTGKEYLDFLPLSKWNRITVSGKLLKGMSVTKLLGCTSSLMCMKKKNGMIEVETPNKGIIKSNAIIEALMSLLRRQGLIS